MIRKLLLLVLLGICGGYAAFAQDPSATGVVFSPTPLQTSQAASITFSFGNGSSADIPTSATATYTLDIPKYVGVVSYSITVPSGSTNTVGNLVVTQTSSATSTILTVKNPATPIPGNAIYDLVVSVIGVNPTPTPPPTTRVREMHHLLDWMLRMSQIMIIPMRNLLLQGLCL
ncbi:hypothetical protein GO730_36515 [Spirosoma sp. HMF3257]|uniref:Calx-beta domain-containing protein n=1 Tax=Spirosoma telluris TaxID=2183553 RepID=A0A327NS77_9BACT|nr:hypothetical protein [Spirosoma telluris]RAI78210.1 hypothetical protein HMF3257_36445 [Spirosoma telluris]